MKKIGMILLFLLLLTACEQTQLSVKLLPTHEVKMENKKVLNIPSNRIQTITEPMLVTVSDWYDDDQILYIRSHHDQLKKNLRYQVIKYHLKTRKTDVFFESRYPISKISPSYHHQYFLIETQGQQGRSIITVLNKSGQVLFKTVQSVEHMDFAWSPFDEEKLLVSSYYYSFQRTKVEIIDIKDSDISKPLQVQPYVQWYNPNMVAFLDWGEGPSLYGMVKALNLENQQMMRLERKAIGFISGKDQYMISSVKKDKNQLVFSFYVKSPKRELSSFKIPLLDSNAGHFWMPYIEWNQNRGVFLSFSPNRSASLFNYNEGFSLTSFNPESGETQVLLEEVSHSPIKCSPSGKYCVFGQRLTNLIWLDTKKHQTIIYTS